MVRIRYSRKDGGLGWESHAGPKGGQNRPSSLHRVSQRAFPAKPGRREAFCGSIRVSLGWLVQLTVTLGSAVWGFVGVKEVLFLMGSFDPLT